VNVGYTWALRRASKTALSREVYTTSGDLTDSTISSVGLQKRTYNNGDLKLYRGDLPPHPEVTDLAPIIGSLA
jgi:hypothetical protein